MFPFVNRLPLQDRPAYRIDAVAAAYYGMFVGFLAPFIPILLKRLGASHLEMALGLAIPFISLILAFPLNPYLGGFRALDLVCYPAFFSRLSVALIGFYPNIPCILGVFFVCQFVEALGLSPYTRVLKEIYSQAGRGPAMGYVRALTAVGMIISSILGGKMIDGGRTEMTFLLAGIAGALSAVAFLRILPRERSPLFSSRTFGLGDISRAFQQSEGFFWLNMVVLFYGFGNLLVIGVLPTMLVERFDISNANLGYLTGLTSLMQVLGYVLIGRIAGRHGPPAALLLGLGVGIANPWIFLAASHLGYLTIPYALNGIMYSAFDITWPMLVLAYAPVEEIGTYASIYTLHIGLRGLVAMFAANLAMATLGANFFLALGGVCMLAGFSIGYIQREAWTTRD